MPCVVTIEIAAKPCHSGYDNMTIAAARCRGATRRVPATNGYPPNPGGRTRTRHRVTRLFRGPEPGPPSTRVPGYPDNIWSRLRLPSGPNTWMTGHTSIAFGARTTSVKRYQPLHSNAGPSPRFRLNEHCYWKFFVGGSTLNKRGHVVAHYPGIIRMHEKCF